MARIIAKVGGDGYLGKHQIMYFNKCSTLMEEFKNDIKSEFGNRTLSEGLMSSGTPYISIPGKDVVTILLGYQNSYKSQDITIPKRVIQTGGIALKEFIRAFYDDEGCAALRLNRKTNEWKRNVTISSNSRKILIQIKEELYKVGIISNKIIRNDPLGNRDKTSALSVTGRENFILFKEKIGFKHPRKIKMLDLIIESYTATSRKKEKFNKFRKKVNKLVISKI